MFVQVPESVNKSIRNGIAPRTEIHYPSISLANKDSRAVWMDNGIDGSRNAISGELECGCRADGVVMPAAAADWMTWSPPMLPSYENYRRSREIDLSLTANSIPKGQGITEITTQKTVAVKEVEMPARKGEHEGESPRPFASSGSTSSRDDMMAQFPDMQSPTRGQTPVPKPRSQQPNPWGRASYSDLITMAITSTSNNMMTLSEIYSWIVKNVPYFNDKGSYLSVQGWKNAVRHTLSLRKRFIRVPDPKRSYKSAWTISSDYQRNHFKKKKKPVGQEEPSKNRRVSAEARKGMTQSMDF